MSASQTTTRTHHDNSARARVGAQSGLGPRWAHRALMGPHMGPMLLHKSLILINNYEIVNKNIEVVKLEIFFKIDFIPFIFLLAIS